MDEQLYHKIIGHYANKILKIWDNLEPDDVFNELWLVGRRVLAKHNPDLGSASNYLHVYFKWKVGYHVRKMVKITSSNSGFGGSGYAEDAPDMESAIDLANLLEREPALGWYLVEDKEQYAASQGHCMESCRRHATKARQRAKFYTTLGTAL